MEPVKNAAGTVLIPGSITPAEALLATSGSILITTTAVHAGPFFALKARGGNAVVDTVTMASGAAAGTDWLSGKTLSEGEIEYGPFASVKLSSGTVVAYLR